MENRLEASVMAKNTVFVRIRTFLCQEKNMYLHNYPGLTNSPQWMQYGHRQQMNFDDRIEDKDRDGRWRGNVAHFICEWIIL